MPKLPPVIMCVGSGARVWPESREGMPRQFILLVGDRSTFQAMVRIRADPVFFRQPIALTNVDYRFRIAEQRSLQKHFHRAEHWIVVRGTAGVTLDDEIRIVHENESIYLPIGCTHRMANPSKIPLEPIEVQTGSYLGEDGIVRIEDGFNRN